MVFNFTRFHNEVKFIFTSYQRHTYVKEKMGQSLVDLVRPGGAIRSEFCYGALSLYTALVPRVFLVFIHSTAFFFSKISNLWNDLKEANLVTQSMHSLKLAKSQLNDQLFTMRLSNTSGCICLTALSSK